MLTARLIRWLDRGERESFGRSASVVGVLCNLALVAAKGIAGLAAGSISVVADAVNNLMDTLSGVVSLVGFGLAQRPADEGHPYGHGRFEYLAGLAVAVLVVVAGAELVRDSIQSILRPAPVAYSAPLVAVLACSTLLKLWLAWFDRCAAKRIDSGTLRAAAQDSLSDALATGSVLAGTLVGWLTEWPLDGPLGLCVGLFVIWSGIGLLRDTVNPLVGKRPDPALVERVRQRILSYPGVLGTHDLMIHDYGPGHRFASAHVEMPAEADPLATHEVVDRIERDLRESEGLATILHYDPIVTRGAARNDMRAQVAHAVERVDPSLSIHDLFVSQTADGLELSFDCVGALGSGAENKELEDAITREVRRFLPGATCRITFDEGYAPTSQ